MMAVIETRGLTKYYGEHRGIEDLDLTVQQGEIFGFIGPNGAGKTTTIRLLLNLIFPTRGIAQVLGMDAVGDTVAIRQRVGYLPADVEYYEELTAGGLLAYAARFHQLDEPRRRINELADHFELDLSRNVAELSTGNKKKVGIIQALLHRPELLILDEPTGGLDPLMQQRLFTLLREEKERGTTIFFSSHILGEVQRLCERVAIIRGGSIVALETVDDLLRNQFRRVRIRFEEGEHPDAAAVDGLAGVIQREVQDRQLQILYHGDINELVAALSQQRLQDLWVEDPSLEEVFLGYYESEGES